MPTRRSSPEGEIFAWRAIFSSSVKILACLYGESRLDGFYTHRHTGTRRGPLWGRWQRVDSGDLNRDENSVSDTATMFDNGVQCVRGQVGQEADVEYLCSTEQMG